jgi:hypothetical protein
MTVEKKIVFARPPGGRISPVARTSGTALLNSGGFDE